MKLAELLASHAPYLSKRSDNKLCLRCLDDSGHGEFLTVNEWAAHVAAELKRAGIVRGRFSDGPGPDDLTRRQVARLMKPNGSAEVFLTCRCGATITAQLVETYEPWRDVNQLSFEAEGWFVDFYTDKPDDTIVRCPQHNRIVSGRP